MTDIPELCSRLQREANARAVMILGLEGEILGHAGQTNGLGDEVIDAVGDATAETLQRAARPDPPPATTEADDPVAQVGAMQICAASLGEKAVLVVVLDDTSNLW